MLENFYTINRIDTGEDGYTAGLELNAAHRVYGGHFPGTPVVPGVCMLEMIKACVSRTTWCSLQYRTIISCKFLTVVDPHVNNCLELSFSLKEEYRVQAVIKAGDEVVLKLKADFIAI